MRKALTLAALVASLGCADFHTEFPVSEGYVLRPGLSVEMDESGTTIILEYNTPKSGDGEMDDTAELTSYGPFTWIHKLEFKIGGKGKFYGCGILFEYNIENDNDGDPSNNVMTFSARLW